MLTVMPIVVVPCLVGGYWLPKVLMRCLVRKELQIEWDSGQHCEGTAVMLKSDKRRGVSTIKHPPFGGFFCAYEAINYSIIPT